MRSFSILILFSLVFSVAACASSGEGESTANEETSSESAERGEIDPESLTEDTCLKGDCKDGEGVFVWQNGAKYAGAFTDGKRNGTGTYTWPSGSTYTGEWQDGKRHGKGTYTWPNGDKYAGEFANDRRHGLGVYTFKEGESISGRWANGLPDR